MEMIKIADLDSNCRLFLSDRLFEWVSYQQKSSLFDGLLFYEAIASPNNWDT